MLERTKGIAAGLVLAASMALGVSECACALTITDYFAMEQAERSVYFVDHVSRVVAGLVSETDAEGKPKTSEMIEQHKDMAAFMRQLFVPAKDDSGELTTPRGTAEVLELCYLFAEVDRDENPEAQFHDESHMENVMAAYIIREYRECKGLPADGTEAAQEAGGETVEDASADEDPAVALLKKLEKADADLRSFTADIFHEKEDALLGDIVRRKGDVIFKVDPESEDRSFAIAFDEVIANNRKREQQKRYVVSGRWLAEIDPEQKLFVKREIVPPGRTFDPFKLGEGPVPLPIGQSADEVLRRFDVALTELPESGPLAKLQGQVEVDGLVLVPKAGTDVADDFERIELFYDRESLLPVGVNVIELNGDRETARLENVRRNPQLTEEELEKLDMTEPDPRQWRIDIQPLE